MDTDVTPTPIVVSAGEPAGIGSDIAIAATLRRIEGDASIPRLVLIGSSEHLSARAEILGCDVPIKSARAFEDCVNVAPDLLPVLELDHPMTALPGKPVESDATAVIEAIRTGVDLIHKGKAAALVTLPINKKSLYDSGFDHPGHTEFLGALAQDFDNVDLVQPVMMLAGPELKAVPVTIHIPLRDVPEALTTDLISDTGRIVARDMARWFGISTPRLAFSGLNPHAGEDGSLGSEDEDIIAPAVEALRSEGINCTGPLPADTMFHAAAREKYDVALCMYHDQALIPAKALGFDDSVNVTLGLPFIRTSPDHGTAFDIAGTGKANPASFIAALKLAAQMAAHNQ